MRQRVKNPANYLRDKLNARRSMTIEIQEIWLRDHQRDLHLIVRDTRTPNDCDREYVCALAANKLPVILDEWLHHELAGTLVGIVKPHIISDPRWFDWLVPYVDFSIEGLARYSAVWEGIDQRALMAGFRRETFEFTPWRTKWLRYNVHSTPLTSPAELWWCDTPIGLLWCPLDFENDFPEGFLNSDHQNLWLRAQEQYPQIANLKLEDVVVGILMPNYVKTDGWFIQVEIPFSLKKNLHESYLGQGYGGPLLPQARTVRQQEICTFLGLGQQPVKFR